MKVCEIFASIQGESSYAAYPCVFVRLTGCNLRCAYCDTTYAYDEGREMDMPEILHAVKAFGIRLVEITGGEPLIQAESRALTDMLINQGYTVLVETNGSMDISDINDKASIILDMKTPSSRMSDKMLMENLDSVEKKDDVKFVISDREDYEWAKDIIRKYSLEGKTNVLLSPVFGVLDPSVLTGWMLDEGVNARLNMQLHKYIFGRDKRKT